jgi:hypothetical protein
LTEINHQLFQNNALLLNWLILKLLVKRKKIKPTQKVNFKMPKRRRKQTSTKKELGTEKLMRNCRVTVTRMSLKDIAAELSDEKCNVDCQLGEAEINRFLTSQKAIAVNQVPIYKRNVNLIERITPKNDVYQFNFDAATELQSTKCRKTRKNTRRAQKGGIRKRKAVLANKKDIVNKIPAVVVKPKVDTQTANVGSAPRTRARSTQLRNSENSIRQPEPTTKTITPLIEGKITENVKEYVPNVSDVFVELEITNSNITDRRLEKVRQFGQSTSTPLMQRKSMPIPSNTTNVPEKSPWRIQEGTRCPKTFYFSCSNDLTPSYASDMISNEANRKTSLFQKSIVREPTPTAVHIVNESFEANNSNAENICPVIGPNKRINVLSNVLLKPAVNRSPLKQMEIIGLQEEEEEPANTSRISTLATHSLTASKVNRIRKFATNTMEKQPHEPLPLLSRSGGSKYQEIIDFFFNRFSFSDLHHEEPPAVGFLLQSSDESTTQRDESNSIEDAFGFYTVDNFDDEVISTDDEQHNYSKSVLKQRLKSLKKLIPQKSTKTTRLACQNPASQLFRSPRRGVKPTNHRDLFEKQLLPEKCSTPQRPVLEENESLTLDEIELTANDAASIRLFNDPLVPEVPKIDHPQRRSYSRIVARKRKRVIGFIAISDDESESDTDIAPVRTKKLVRTKKKVNVEEVRIFFLDRHKYRCLIQNVYFHCRPTSLRRLWLR